MRRTLATATVLTAMSMSAAEAATLHETANIKSLNVQSRELVLSSGMSFKFPRSMKLSRFHHGDRVRVSYRMGKHARLLMRVRKVGVEPSSKRHVGAYIA